MKVNKTIKKSLIAIVISIVMILVMLVSSTYAWFIFTRETNVVIYQSGEVKYVLSGDLKDSSIITPGEELVESQISIECQSNVQTQLRIRISYQIEGEEVKTLASSSDINTLDLIAEIDSSFQYNEADNYWYYYYNDNEVIPEVTTDNLEIVIITSLKYNGLKYGTNEMKKRVSVHLAFEAKQYENVGWDDIAWQSLSTIIIN